MFDMMYYREQHAYELFGQIEYKGRGYFSGKTHQFKASVAKSGSWSAKHTIDGLWHTSSKFSTGQGFLDISTQTKEEVIVTSLESQNEWESRKLWCAVAKGIREGDFDAASREKSKIENEQRQRRRDETAAGTKWELKHFKHIDSDPLCKRGATTPTEFANSDLQTKRL